MVYKCRGSLVQSIPKAAKILTGIGGPNVTLAAIQFADSAQPLLAEQSFEPSSIIRMELRRNRSRWGKGIPN